MGIRNCPSTQRSRHEQLVGRGGGEEVQQLERCTGPSSRQDCDYSRWVESWHAPPRKVCHAGSGKAVRRASRRAPRTTWHPSRCRRSLCRPPAPPPAAAPTRAAWASMPSPQQCRLPTTAAHQGSAAAHHGRRHVHPGPHTRQECSVCPAMAGCRVQCSACKGGGGVGALLCEPPWPSVSCRTETFSAVSIRWPIITLPPWHATPPAAYTAAAHGMSRGRMPAAPPPCHPPEFCKSSAAPSLGCASAHKAPPCPPTPGPAPCPAAAPIARDNIIAGPAPSTGQRLAQPAARQLPGSPGSLGPPPRAASSGRLLRPPPPPPRPPASCQTHTRPGPCPPGAAG